MSDEEIINYYRDALAAQGYAVERITNESGGDQSFSFARPNVMSGYVSVKGDKDSLSRKYKDFFTIGYDLIKK